MKSFLLLFTVIFGLIFSTICFAESSIKSNFFKDIGRDYKNAYSFSNIAQYIALVGVGGVIANTDADENIRKWYQNDVRSSKLDDFFKPINNTKTQDILYGLVGVTALSSLLPGDNILWKYTSNTLRGALISLPQQGGIARFVTGHRPNQNSPNGSHWEFEGWNPRSRSASGHAVTFSVPLFTAANMLNNKFAKIFFNALALAPAVARVNGEHHYFSQVLIGTGLGFLAARSVSKTNKQRESESRFKRTVSFAPIALPHGGYGLALQMQF